jgi:hypothetical protein
LISIAITDKSAAILNGWSNCFDSYRKYLLPNIVMKFDYLQSGLYINSWDHNSYVEMITNEREAMDKTIRHAELALFSHFKLLNNKDTCWSYLPYFTYFRIKHFKFSHYALRCFTVLN